MKADEMEAGAGDQRGQALQVFQWGSARDEWSPAIRRFELGNR